MLNPDPYQSALRHLDHIEMLLDRMQWITGVIQMTFVAGMVFGVVLTLGFIWVACYGQLPSKSE